ncbi:DMT family transporter [uncultured Roseibium sp.]|uniref:DMT family transporter n=1 Tax=uncultured Roseibium sp. TaxID=1936171 RepID=UPI00321656D2
MTLRNWMLLLTLGAIWGGSFLFAKVAVAEIPPLVLVFCRVAIACAALHIVLRFTSHRFPVQPRMLVAFLTMGFLNNAVPFSLLFWGQTEVSAGLASILNATTPIFTFIVAALIVRQEPVRAHRVAGVLIGFAGVLVMVASSITGLSDDPLWAQLACLGGAFSYALAATFARRFRSIPPLVSATGQLSGSTLIMLPVALLAAGNWSPLQTSAFVWLNVLALGIGATALAYLIYFRLLADAGATNASLVTFIVPASAILFGFLLLGERLTTYQFAGLGLLLTGLLVLDGRILPKRRQPA